MTPSIQAPQPATVEEAMLAELRSMRREQRSDMLVAMPPREMTFGDRVADRVAATMGSWTFIIVQTIILTIWIVLNVAAYVRKWDPYPFILLNLALSFEAAYSAPFIMMSQNRQQNLDRKEAESDHQINIKAELEIELLHEKVDEMRQKEILMLTQAVTDLTTALRREQDKSARD